MSVLYFSILYLLGTRIYIFGQRRDGATNKKDKYRPW